MSPEPERPREALQPSHPSDETPAETLDLDVPAALAGAVFPLSAQQLVRVARENEAPGRLLTLLSGLAHARFDSLEAVAQGLAHASQDAGAQQR